MQLKKKTIDYLKTSANKLETLFGLAVEYRAKFDRATSPMAKQIYAKKLKKTVKKMEPYMGLFKDMQKLKEMKESAETVDTSLPQIEEASVKE